MYIRLMIMFLSILVSISCVSSQKTEVIAQEENKDTLPDVEYSEPSFNPSDISGCTVYVLSQSNVNETEFSVHEVGPDVNIRAMMKWSKYGDNPLDYDFTPIKRYHENGIRFIGGGTASVIFEGDFKSKEIFKDMATRDASNRLVTHNEVVEGAYRGSLANPRFRQYIIDWCRLQIDGGVDGLFFDEVAGAFSGGSAKNYNENEGFEDYFIADFNKYLLDKYPDYTEEDWKNNFGMNDKNIIRTDVRYDNLENNFNYRKYLAEHGWNGDTPSTNPHNKANPLAAEWGNISSNRLYQADTFLTAYVTLYWKEIVEKVRTYAREKYGKNILITSNGIFPFVDFNSLGMYAWNPDEETQDRKGADYVPVTFGHLNASKSLMQTYRKLNAKNRETAGTVPLVTFIDWPTETINGYNSLPIEEKKDYWRIFGAETYACGLYPAFHLKDTIGGLTAADAGMLPFFKEYKKFYKINRDVFDYKNYYYSNAKATVNRNSIALNLMKQNDGSRYAVHLVNHRYSDRIIPQENFMVAVTLEKSPVSAYMISPDFKGRKKLSFDYQNNELRIDVDKIVYYDVIVINTEP
jgi:hypothetical protein